MLLHVLSYMSEITLNVPTYLKWHSYKIKGRLTSNVKSGFNGTVKNLRFIMFIVRIYILP